MLGSFRRRGCTCKKKRCTCGSKWYYRYDIIDPKTGKRKQKEVGGFTTKPEAEAAAKRILAKLQDGVYIEEKDTVFSDFAETWIDLYAKKKNIKPSTVDIRRRRLKWLKEYFAQLKLKTITRTKYQEMLDGLADQDLARKTIASIHETGSLLFKKAVEMGIIASDPSRNVEMPAIQKTVEELESATELPKYLEKEELAKFLNTAKDYGKRMDYAIFMTIAYTGFRAGELCALKWRDIDFESQVISITKTLYNPTNNYQKYTLQTPKTKSSIRTIDVDKSVLDVLMEHKKMQENIKQRFDSYHGKDFVFARDTSYLPGYPLLTNGLIRRMVRLLILADLNPELTPHSLRHTHTSLLAEAGVDLETIMNRLGHESDIITKKVYLHVTKPRKKEASKRFADLMKNI